MEINGKISVIGNLQHIGDSFIKRELVIVTEEQYPQHILIEFHSDKCAFLDYYRLGEYVKVQINLRGRKWTNPEGVDKYFNTLVAWKIDRLNVEHLAAAAPVRNEQAAFAPQTNDVPQEELDDLPF